MMGAWGAFADRWLGRGDAAVTVPPFDGALKPNLYLEQAEVFAEIDAADLATDGRDLFVASGARVLRYRDGEASEVAAFDGRVTALCASPNGLAVALDGKRIVGAKREWAGFHAINALAAGADGALLATEGSRAYGCEQWSHDLMTLGATGRLLEIPANGEPSALASGRAFAFGACLTPSGEAWFSESWRHRVVRADGSTVIDALPCYPSRLTPASGGGFWLTAFVARTQLVEFVLREKAYRERMIREVDPRFWIAPKLRSGETFLEPMQGAHIKTMGVLKPWAPPVSYGLVIRLGADGQPVYSLHSRAGGRHHGVTAAVELDGSLYVLSQGAGRILRLPIAKLDAELRS